MSLMLAAAVLAGCAEPRPVGGGFPGPTMRSALAGAGVRDGRTDFQAAFCAHYRATKTHAPQACEHWFVLPEESAPAAVSGRRAQATIVIIPGILGECVSKWVTPFSHDYEHLRGLGYRVEVIPVTGRGSSAVNAGHIHAFFENQAVERAIVIGYSKGVTDYMLAASQPRAAGWRGRVAALVSVAGVVNGTPVAGRSEDIYQHVLSRLPWSSCGPSDGGGVANLTYGQAFDIAGGFAHTPRRYPVYSIAAVADDSPVNPMLRGFHRWLNTLDRRNDGQVLMEDVIVPGSTFLGAMRADHWSIALPFEDSDAALMRPFGIDNHFPRHALLMAVLDIVERDISGGKE
jgi:hypothetical protein